MKLYKILVCMICLLLIGHFSIAADDLTADDNWDSIKDRVLHTGTTDKPVKVRWDGNGSIHHTVQAWIPFYEAMADPKVTYKIYDDQTEVSVREIDQTKTKYNNRWVDISDFPVGLSTGTLRVVLEVNNSNKYAAASAIRYIFNGCEDKANGTQILGQAAETSSTGTWSDAGGNFLHKFGTGTPRKLMGTGTYTWTFTGVRNTNVNITYDVYIKHFPTNQIYSYVNVDTCGYPMMLPKTGHYVFHVRTLDGLLGMNNASLDGKTYDELVAIVNDSAPTNQWKCSQFYLQNNLVNPKTADNLKLMMQKASECSTWTESIDATNSIVDCEKKAWWVYGYPAPVGPIIIE